MTRVLSALLIVLLLAPPAAAQAPQPLLAQARAAMARQTLASDYVVVKSRMEHPILFWTGVGLLALGVIAMVGAVSFAQESDLSQELVGIRLGTDLAPCGTAYDETRLPVADCSTNDELFWLGAGLAAAGGGLMVFGGTKIETLQARPMLTARVRF